VLDTGASVALVRTDVARELGLQLGAPVKAGGAGPGTQSGYYSSAARRVSLVGLEDLALPVNMALPLPELPRALGRRSTASSAASSSASSSSSSITRPADDAARSGDLHVHGTWRVHSELNS
jgi:hypothetical protein